MIDDGLRTYSEYEHLATYSSPEEGEVVVRIAQYAEPFILEHTRGRGDYRGRHAILGGVNHGVRLEVLVDGEYNDHIELEGAKHRLFSPDILRKVLSELPETSTSEEVVNALRQRIFADIDREELYLPPPAHRLNIGD